MRIKNLILLAGLLMLGFTSCKDNEREAETMDTVQEENFDDRLENARTRDDVVNAVETNPELSTFATGLNAWNVGDNVRDAEEDILVFAPSNLAYSKVFQREGQGMMELDSEEIVPYHIIKTSSDLAGLKMEIRNANDTITKQTMQGEDLKLSLDGNSLVLTGITGVSARIIDSVQAGNGMVYIIDTVLFPRDTSREVIITEEE